jgi:hypothetical protein
VYADTAAAAGAFTLTLPSGANTGVSFRIKDITGSAGFKNVTVAGNGQNIDGSANYVINTAYGGAQFIYSGSQWSVIDTSAPIRLPTFGTTNSQTNRLDTVFGNAETVSSATPTNILTYATASNSGGLMTINLVSRSTTAGTGIAAQDTTTSTYVLAYKNTAGTVALSTLGITLVGSAQTTAAALTSTLTATVATNVITILVTNPNLSTVDSEVMAQIVVN